MSGRYSVSALQEQVKQAAAPPLVRELLAMLGFMSVPGKYKTKKDTLLNHAKHYTHGHEADPLYYWQWQGCVPSAHHTCPV